MGGGEGGDGTVWKDLHREAGFSQALVEMSTFQFPRSNHLQLLFGVEKSKGT